jgi:hypothetical protein
MSDDLFADAADEPAPLEALRCANCMQVHSQCSDNAAALVKAQIRHEIDNRLDRLEYLLGEMHEGDRVAVARWVQGALDRPPLSNRGVRSIEPIRAVLDALWRDIYDRTPDPMMPTFEFEGETWAIEQPHHELLEMRPDAA